MSRSLVELPAAQLSFPEPVLRPHARLSRPQLPLVVGEPDSAAPSLAELRQVEPAWTEKTARFARNWPGCTPADARFPDTICPNPRPEKGRAYQPRY